MPGRAATLVMALAAALASGCDTTRYYLVPTHRTIERDVLTPDRLPDHLDLQPRPSDTTTIVHRDGRVDELAQTQPYRRDDVLVVEAMNGSTRTVPLDDVREVRAERVIVLQGRRTLVRESVRPSVAGALAVGLGLLLVGGVVFLSTFSLSGGEE
ncbi:MAG: hypothetical protein U1F43_31050 [Myxococcota bacterium]